MMYKPVDSNSMQDDPYDAVILRGNFTELCLPATLYHGTSSDALEAIMREGLRPDLPGKQSALSSNAVYMITDLTMAAHMARSRAFRHGREPAVIAIDTRDLDPDQLGFDLNMSGAQWTESLAYGAAITPGSLSTLSDTEVALPARPMILGDPVPGEKPIAFRLDWARAEDFMAACRLPAALHP